ncbi:MAG: hypothetical protein WD491_10830 [Balneolales bacterium]
MIDLRKDVQQAGFLTKEQLKLLALWKSPRSAGHIEKNREAYIKEITMFSLSATDERSIIETLTLLDGVGWPTASVILHLFHKDPYPILDFRALWSVEAKLPSSYAFSFWWDYVRICRAMALRNGVDMRTLDRALWQYSKENQVV